MRQCVGLVIGAMLVVAPAVAWAHSEHEHEGSAGSGMVGGGSQEQELTGEVVDVFCYLTHGAQGLGKGHAECARKCIRSGLPVALRVGDQLYLAVMDSHEGANNTLAPLAGTQVTVHGKVMERDGQHLVAITEIEKAK